MTKCPWCGNSSGKTDARGMCVSCGGALETRPLHSPEWIKDWGEGGNYDTYNDHSGSSCLFGEMGREIFSPNEFRRLMLPVLPDLAQPNSPIPTHGVSHGFPTIICYRGKPVDTLSDDELEEAKQEYRESFNLGWIPELNFYA